MSAHVDPRSLEDAAGSVRRAMLEHLATCAACRAAAAEADPSLLFGLLALCPVPTPVLESVSRGVASSLARAPFRRAAAAAVVAAALLSGLATLHRSPVAPAPVAALPARPATVEVRPDPAVAQVVDLTVGDTQVVMVYNGNLHL